VPVGGVDRCGANPDQHGVVPHLRVIDLLESQGIRRALYLSWTTAWI